MDSKFLLKLQTLHSRTENAPEGISIDDIPSSEELLEYSNVMVIPSGLTKETLNHLTRLGSHVADCVDRDYPEESIETFIKLTNDMKPSVIVAGSRGTGLVRAFLKKIKGTTVTRVVLFGPVHLLVFFEACPTTLNVLIVHGKHDTNERINTVRGLVQEFRATLVETNQAHGLNMEYDSVHKLIKYIY